MPPRPMLPKDDLYARLELPIDASFEAVEVAWRALLKRHHPDVAGAGAEDVAKRINVAHDWLSDPELRARYDRERQVRPSRGRATAPGGRTPRRPGRPRPRRPVDPAEALARHLERVSNLTPGEMDRLTLAETPPIAFVASISRFLSDDAKTAVESAERRVLERLPRSIRWDAAARDAAVGFAHEIVLGSFLDSHLSEPFRERVRERLARGWESAVGQPRYGPNTVAIGAALDRLRDLPPGRRAQLAAAAAAAGGALTVEPPWPAGLSPGEDDALRVSSALAQRDAQAILVDPAPAVARRSLGRAVHALVLRHAFKPAEFDRLVGPWREVLVEPAGPAPAARRRA